ncbi:MAG: YbaK/EbsC family protein [Candidatus Hermodarchaeota archaeon]
MTDINKKIIQKLENAQVDYKLYEHEPVYTCEQAAEVRGISPAEGIKCLLMKVDEHFILVLTRGDRRLTLRKLFQLEKAKKVRFAKAEEVLEVAGCEIGCVHPFIDVKTYVDKILAETSVIEFNPARHDQSIRIKTEDLLSVLKEPILAELSL